MKSIGAVQIWQSKETELHWYGRTWVGVCRGGVLRGSIACEKRCKLAKVKCCTRGAAVEFPEPSADARLLAWGAEMHLDVHAARRMTFDRDSKSSGCDACGDMRVRGMLILGTVLLRNVGRVRIA
jgi:hypothetical protein